MRKRNIVVPVYMTAEEYAYLKRQAEICGLPKDAFLRALMKNVELRPKPSEHHPELLRKIAGLVNNANQIARIANTTKTVSQSSVDALLSEVRTVWAEAKGLW